MNLRQFGLGLVLAALLTTPATAQQSSVPVISGNLSIEIGNIPKSATPTVSALLAHVSYARAQLSAVFSDGVVVDIPVDTAGAFATPIDAKYLGQTYTLKSSAADGVLLGSAQGTVAVDAPAVTLPLKLFGRNGPSGPALAPQSHLADLSSLQKVLSSRRTYATRSFYFVSDRAVDSNAYTPIPDNSFHIGTFSGYAAIGNAVPAKWQTTAQLTTADLTFVDNSTDPAHAADLTHGLAAIATDVSTNGSDVLLFVHGFNSTLDSAETALAELAFTADWGLKPAIVYDWPSQGVFLGYTADSSVAGDPEENAHFSQFLSGLVAAVPSIRLHIVAHSMGNRLTLEAFLRDPTVDAAVASVDFFAGDVLPGAVAPGIAQLSGARKTVYFNDNDLALHGSTCFNHQDRLGLGEGSMPAGVSKFDATPFASTDGFGHGYFGNTTSVATEFNRQMNGSPTSIASSFASVPWLSNRAVPLKHTIQEDIMEGAAACSVAGKIL